MFKVIFNNMCHVIAQMNTYLQSFIPFADVPSQITKDFARAKVRFDPLTPDRLRIELKRDSHVHCSRLHGRHEVVSAMLKFCLSDIIDDVTNDESSLSEYQQRRNFLVMEGCPLLSMANGQTCCFPRERVGSLRDGDPVYLASLSLHAIMNPAVRGALIHPTAFNDVPLALENSVFKDALQMKDVSTAFIHVSDKLIFSYLNCTKSTTLINYFCVNSTSVTSFCRLLGNNVLPSSGPPPTQVVTALISPCQAMLDLHLS